MSLTDARRYIADVHRHNLPPKFGIVSIGLENDVGELVGVAILGRPVSRMFEDGRTAEVRRLATDGTDNACSMLYGACSRAAKAIGYTRLFTYTLQEESGSSLRASGWRVDAELKARESVDSPSRPRVLVDLFGNERAPSGPKVRWVKQL